MRIKQVYIAALCWVGLLGGCSFDCETSEDIQVTFLVDISDERLLRAAKDDIQSNLGNFMNKLDLASLDDCQQLTVNIAPLSARDELKLESTTLSLTHKGLSARERRKRSSPKPIIQMIDRELSTYDSLRNVPDYQRGSSIGNQILKAINQTKSATQSYVVVFSDMVQHDQYISFYRSIPRKIDASNMQMLFDPMMLKEWPGTSEDVQVIIIHLQQVDASMKGKRREIAALWSQAFEEGLGLDVAVMDNLTH